MHVSIGKAVDWIAQNDEAGILEIPIIRDSVTCLLVADLFDKEPSDIACRIYNRRKEIVREST
jgi:hypothetical protein